MVWIVAVILVAGLVGGLAGNLAREPAAWTAGRKIGDRKSGDGESDNVPIVTDLIVGTVASFCTPIFLLVTQSKLMDTLQSDVQKNLNPFWELVYLGGYCLVAAFSARAFMQSVSNQILKMRDDQRKIQAKQDQLEDVQDELKDDVSEIDAAMPESSKPAIARGVPYKERQLLAGSGDSEKPDLSGLRSKLSTDDRRVLEALNNERYARRSLTGISRDADISKPDASLVLHKLERLGLVSHRNSDRTGRLLYQLEPDGASLLQSFGIP